MLKKKQIIGRGVTSIIFIFAEVTEIWIQCLRLYNWYEED